MKKSILGVAALATLGLAVVASAGDSPTRTEGTIISPVKAEMRLLNEAFKNLVDCLVLGYPEGIEEPFHEVHRAKMNTEKALKKGEISLPKNGDKIKQFVEMDEKFHHNLEELIEASRKKDMNAVQDVTHRLLNGCVQCHGTFRN